MDKLNRRNLLLKKELQYCVKDQMSQFMNNNSTHVEEFFTACSNMSNAIFRAMWLIVGICCFSTCIYQVCDRIEYYLSCPVRTDVETNSKPIIMPPFSLSGVDTEKLRRYWNLLKNKKDSDWNMRCHLPYLAFNLPHNISVNYTEFWLATNVTPNIQRIKVVDKITILTDIHLNMGNITYSSNSSAISWSNRNTVLGSAIIFKMNEKINLDTSVSIQLRNTGYLQPALVTIAIDNLLPFHDYVTTAFGRTTILSYSIKRYAFLNNQNKPCEPNEENREKCFRDCLAKKFQTESCWLPFMPIDLNIIDCSELQNATLAANVFQTSFTLLKSISPEIHCFCQQSCAEIKLYLKVEHKNTGDASKFTLEYESREATETEIIEKLAYDAISLLVDIGGTMGLFLGLSVSTIFKIFQLNSFHLCKSVKHGQNGKQTKYNLRVRTELSLLLLRKKIIDKRSHTSVENFKVFFIVILTVSAILLMYLQINTFFSYPTKIIVELTDIDTVYIPNIIACGQGSMIDNIKIHVAKTTKSNDCQLHILDLIDHVNTGNSIQSKVELLWPAQKIPYAVSRPEASNVSTVNMYSGSCREITFKPEPFVGVSNLHILQFQTFGNISCTQKLFQLYLRSPETNYYSTIFNQLDLMSGLHSAAIIETNQIDRYNSPIQPCTNYQVYDDCRLNCYKSKMQYLIKCRLPFMDGINISICNTTATAKESLSTFLGIILRGKCSCFRPCVETTYKITWGFNNEYDPLFTKIHIITLTNLIEHLRQIPSYNFVSLWCVLGNILGVTLGLSVLSSFHGIFVYFNSLSKRDFLKHK